MIPPEVSVMEMLFPVAPTVRRSTEPRVMLPAVVPVPAFSVTTVPVVLAVNALAPWMMLPFKLADDVLIETAPVVDETLGAIVSDPFVGAETVTVGDEV